MTVQDAVATITKSQLLCDADCEAFRNELSAAVQSHEGVVTVDFKDVEFMSSACLSALLKNRRRLHLANVRPNIAEVFEITRLSHLIPIN